MSLWKDPKFAPAYACLSQCYNLLGFYEYDHPINVFNERASWLIWLKEDPMFDELKGEKRFQELVIKLNMT